MAWNKEDLSFKTLLNKRVTNSSKRHFEEFGDFTIDISASEIKAQDIPLNDPAAGISSGVVKGYTLFPLTKDNSVDGDQSYYAFSTTDTTRSVTDNRLRDWISDKWGSAYAPKLYDANDVLVPATHASNWLFNAITGILVFNGDTSTLAKPLKITGYRYIGKKGVKSGVAAGVSVTYNQLKALVDNGTLEAGTQYLISDFKTIHTIPGATNTTVNTFTSAVEPLYVRALTNNKLEGRAISATFPNDMIVYDIANNTTEASPVTARPGKIVFRADMVRNISAYYDWRNVNFRRWIRTSDGAELSTDLPLLSTDGTQTYAPHTVYNQTTFNTNATVTNVHLPATSLYGGYNNVIFRAGVNGLQVVRSLTDTVFYNTVGNSIIGDGSANIFYGDFLNNEVKVIKSNVTKAAFSDNKIHSMQNTKADFALTFCTIENFDTNTVKSAVSKLIGYTISGNTINAAVTNCKFQIDIQNLTFTAALSGLNIVSTTASGKFVSTSYADGGELVTTLITP